MWQQINEVQDWITSIEASLKERIQEIYIFSSLQNMCCESSLPMRWNPGLRWGRRQIPSFETDPRPRGRPCQHQAMAAALIPSNHLALSHQFSTSSYPSTLVTSNLRWYSYFLRRIPNPTKEGLANAGPWPVPSSPQNIHLAVLNLIITNSPNHHYSCCYCLPFLSSRMNLILKEIWFQVWPSPFTH